MGVKLTSIGLVLGPVVFSPPFKKKNIYLTVLGLSCGMWDLFLN